MKLDSTNFKNILGFKFTFLCLVYFYIITYLGTTFTSKPALVTILSFVCIFHLFSRVKYPIIPSVLLAIPISFDAFFAFVYRNHMAPENMASIMETNVNEASGMLSIFWLPALSIFITTTLLIYLSSKEFRKVKIKAWKSFTVLLVFWFAFMPFMLYRKVKANYRGYEFTEQPTIMAQNFMHNDFPILYNSLICTAAYYSEKHKIKNLANSVRTLPEGITFDKSSETPQKIYFVLGESARRKNFSLYGYEIKTTPFLDSLKSTEPSAIDFYKGVSPANTTRSSIRLSLSFSTPRNFDYFYTKKNIIDLANDAGYETLWLSNQEYTIGVNDSFVGFISYCTSTPIYNNEKGDLTLIPQINKYRNNSKKQFFIIHQDGSHQPYRYDSIDVEALAESIEHAEYNRTIHHTDRVLKEIYKIASQDSSSIVYYISDHGEVLGSIHGHALLVKGTEQFDIPFVVMNNSKTNTDSIISKYIDTDSGNIFTANNIYIMAEILGYRIADEVAKSAIEKNKYVYQINGKTYHYEDVVNNNIDY